MLGRRIELKIRIVSDARMSSGLRNSIRSIASSSAPSSTTLPACSNYRTGSIDLMEFLNPDDIPSVRNDANLQLILRPSMNVGYLCGTWRRSLSASSTSAVPLPMR